MQFTQHFFDFLSPVGPDILLAYPILKHPLQKDWGIFRRVRKIGVQRLLASGLSVCPHGTIRLPMDGFSLDLISEDFFFKSVLKVQI